jgi:hypothetical protein
MNKEERTLSLQQFARRVIKMWGITAINFIQNFIESPSLKVKFINR